MSSRRVFCWCLVALFLLPLARGQEAPRNLTLEGQDHFRDVGGYQTATGPTVRWGRIYRSGALNALTDADLKRLEDKGIKTVIDLRTDYEVKRAPDRLPKGVKYVHLPVGSDEEIKKYFEPASADELLKASSAKPGYVYSLKYASQYAKALTLMADPGNQPLIIHCTAGKDRTGVAAALLLWSLDVPDETVVGDYLLTNKYWKADRAKHLAALRKKIAGLKNIPEDQVDLQALEARMTANKEALPATRKLIEQEYGSLDTYFDKGLNLSEDCRKSLKHSLLQPEARK
jgi:protein-tyrosine phosphatase